MNSMLSLQLKSFRVQCPWSIKNPQGDNPNEEEILKPACFVIDFAPTRALRLLSEYATNLSPTSTNPEQAVQDLIASLPAIAYDGSYMKEVNASEILDIAIAGTSAALLARKWESNLLINVDNQTLSHLLSDPKALDALERIEGWRSLGENLIQTIINRHSEIKQLKQKARSQPLSDTEQKELDQKQREYKSKRKQIQEKLIKFLTRVPVFMYLTDHRENTLQDVIQHIEPDLFRAVTGLEKEDFALLVKLNLLKERLDQAIFAFRRYEDSSLIYTGLTRYHGIRQYGLLNTVVEEVQT